MNKKEKLVEIAGLTETAYKKAIFRSKFYLKKIRNKLHKDDVVSKEMKLTHTFAMLYLNQNIVVSKTIKQLIFKSHFEEALILMRVLMERSALVYRSLEGNLVVEDIEKLQASKCIKYLKRHFNYSGNLYGLFSEVIHSNPRFLLHFSILGLFSKGKNIKSEKANEIKLLVLMLLIFTLEVNFAIIKFLAKDYVKTKTWSLENNLWLYSSISKSKLKTVFGGLVTLYRLYDKEKP